MSALPMALAEGTHEVVFQPRQEDPMAELKGMVDRRYVHMKFTETRGGTELGFELDEDGSDLSGADWSSSSGTLHMEGELNLDGVRVRCVVDLDIETAKGTGRLDIL